MCSTIVVLALLTSAPPAPDPASVDQLIFGVSSPSYEELARLGTQDNQGVSPTPQATKPEKVNEEATGAPSISIKYDQPHNLGYLTFTNSGGDIRDWQVVIEPALDPKDIVYKDNDRMQMCIAADPGLYTVDIVGAGVKAGAFHKRQSFEVKSSHPVPKAPTAVPNAMPDEAGTFTPNPAETPIQAILRALGAVKTVNRVSEANKMAAAMQGTPTWGAAAAKAASTLTAMQGDKEAWLPFFSTVNSFYLKLYTEQKFTDPRYTEAGFVASIVRELAEVK